MPCEGAELSPSTNKSPSNGMVRSVENAFHSSISFSKLISLVMGLSTGIKAFSDA